MNEYPFLVGGEWRRCDVPLEVRFPYTGEPVALVHQAGEQDLHDAAEYAGKAFETTRDLSSAERSRILTDLAGRVKERTADFVDILVLEGA